MKLTVIGKPLCGGCVMLKGEIYERLDELRAINVDFEYVDLNLLGEEKEAFIHKHSLSALPTILIQDNEVVLSKISGYMDLDSLIDRLKELK